MFDPQDVLTKGGCGDASNHLWNMGRGVQFFLDHADDLHIGALDDSQLELLYKFEEACRTWLLTGDGEEREE